MEFGSFETKSTLKDWYTSIVLKIETLMQQYIGKLLKVKKSDLSIWKKVKRG